MGGKNTKFEALSKIDVNEWKSIGSENGADIVKSNKGYGQGQIRMISLDPKRTVEEQMEIYNYRKNQNNALVSCYGVQSLKAQSTTMCGNQQNLKVLTERMPTRWPLHPPIAFPQSLYALEESLKGFNDLHNKAGPFQITPNLIGINNQNEVKVWLNQNFAENHPVAQKPFLQTTISDSTLPSSSTQRNMVRTIITIIQSKCEEGSFPSDFKDKIYRNSFTFTEALQTIEQYSIFHNINLPEEISMSYQRNNVIRQPNSQQLHYHPQQVALQTQQKPIFKMQSVPQNIPHQQINPNVRHVSYVPPRTNPQVNMYDNRRSVQKFEYGDRNRVITNQINPSNRFTYQSSSYHKPPQYHSNVHHLSPRGSKVNFNMEGGRSLQPRQF